MSWAIWITGIPGSGKSVLARAASAELRSLGHPVRTLELDEIRTTLTPAPLYTDSERDIVYRALGWMAALLTDAHVPVIIDATAHRRAWRDLARAAIPRFAEVQIVCPPETARERERTRSTGHAPRGIYERAGRPAATVPGVNVPYEPALDPELVIDSARESVPEAAHRIAALGIRLGASSEPPPLRKASWAIWITGRPGSGKTTIAFHVRKLLSACGVPVRVLDILEVRRLLLPSRPGSEHELEIVHLALAYAAKLLTEAGVAVIVDATAAKRAWREAARASIPCFVEVQLVCPRHLCLERDRACRWGLDIWSETSHPVAARDVAPDLAIDYEESLRPELMLRTDEKDASTCAQEVLLLVQRLGARQSDGPDLPRRRHPCASARL